MNFAGDATTGYKTENFSFTIGFNIPTFPTPTLQLAGGATATLSLREGNTSADIAVNFNNINTKRLQIYITAHATADNYSGFVNNELIADVTLDDIAPSVNNSFLDKAIGTSFVFTSYFQ